MGNNGLKLHLGCGGRFIPGFVHVDLVAGEHVDYVQDVRLLPMFEDNSAELIYASHVLEYFDWFEVIDVLREWRRVLEPDGTLRLAVPDFDALMRVRRKTGSLALLWGSLYGRIETNQSFTYHECLYDFPTLTTTLRLAGFKNIHRWDWRKTEHADVDDCSQAYYPHMDKEHGLLLSLNVEAMK
jgi:ubiquinone/menaquinone biosynthesis C-methylase UbiE